MKNSPVDFPKTPPLKRSFTKMTHPIFYLVYHKHSIHNLMMRPEAMHHPTGEIVLSWVTCKE
jgi:hypothetical protein